MALEDEIKQRKFKNEYQKLGINLAYTSSFMLNHNMRFLKKFGLTLPQFNILRILRGQHPKATTVNDLIDRMLDKSSNASRIVEKLRSKNLVVRKVSESDRRAVDVTITEAGLALLPRIDAQETKLYCGDQVLTVEEAKTLNDLLDKARSQYSDEF